MYVIKKIKSFYFYCKMYVIKSFCSIVKCTFSLKQHLESNQDPNAQRAMDHNY